MNPTSPMTRRGAAAAILALAAAPSLARAAMQTFPVVGRVERLDPALDALVDADAVVEQVLDGFTWSEGPVWVGGKDGFLLVSDVPANKILRWTPAGGGAVWLTPSGYAGPETGSLREAGSNGLILARGGLVIGDSGNRCVSRIDLKTQKKTVLASSFEGKRFNSPNDVIVARRGALKDTLYFTDPPYGLEGLNASPIKELAFNGVYLRRPSGEVAVVDDKLTFPNGLALSPDERRLYVAVSDPEGPVIMAYDLGSDGMPTSRKLFFDAAELLKAGGPGLPDGMRVDAKGRLFATGPGGVLVLTPEAKLLGVIETGFPTANCTFGEDGKTLFLTSNHVLARVRTRTSSPAW